MVFFVSARSLDTNDITKKLIAKEVEEILAPIIGEHSFHPSIRLPCALKFLQKIVGSLRQLVQDFMIKHNLDVGQCST